MPVAAYGKMQQEKIKKLRAAKYPIPLKTQKEDVKIELVVF